MTPALRQKMILYLSANLGVIFWVAYYWHTGHYRNFSPFMIFIVAASSLVFMNLVLILSFIRKERKTSP